MVLFDSAIWYKSLDVVKLNSHVMREGIEQFLHDGFVCLVLRGRAKSTL